MTDPKLRRRYVYMSDAEWEWLKGRAAEAGAWPSSTISAVVRSLVEDAQKPLSIAVGPDTVTIDPPPAKGRIVAINWQSGEPETATVPPGPGYGNSVIAETPPRWRAAPKPAPRKKR